MTNTLTTSSRMMEPRVRLFRRRPSLLLATPLKVTSAEANEPEHRTNQFGSTNLGLRQIQFALPGGGWVSTHRKHQVAEIWDRPRFTGPLLIPKTEVLRDFFVSSQIIIGSIFIIKGTQFKGRKKKQKSRMSNHDTIGAKNQNTFCVAL